MINKTSQGKNFHRIRQSYSIMIMKNILTISKFETLRVVFEPEANRVPDISR